MKNTNALSKRSLKAYSLLKDLLLRIYNVDCHRSAYPYDNIEDMDRGIRKMMWEGFDYTNNPDTRLIEETDKLFIVASNLGFYNIVMYLPTGDHPDLITIGPFRNEDATPAYFEQIIQAGEVPHSKILVAENVFRGLPKADYTTIVAMSKRIVSEYFPGFEDVEETKI